MDNRQVGKIWRYTADSLRETLARCVAYYGHVPQVAEFEWWRQHQLELGRASGQRMVHLPSGHPYRRRFGTWEKTLLHFGYSRDEIRQRLDVTPK